MDDGPLPMTKAHIWPMAGWAKKVMFKYHFQQNISVFLWQPVLLVNKNGEKHQASVSHSQSLFYFLPQAGINPA